MCVNRVLRCYKIGTKLTQDHSPADPGTETYLVKDWFQKYSRVIQFKCCKYQEKD